MKSSLPRSAALSILLALLAHHLLAAAPPTPAGAPATPDIETHIPSSTTARLVPLEPDMALLAPPDSAQSAEGKFAIASTQPRIRFALLPGQWEGARLWSSWGDAEFAGDGNYYVSIGDHGQPHGHCYIYRVNPETGEIKLVIDINAVLGRGEARYTPGKIHAPLVDTGDGSLYFGTYHGSVAGTTAEADHQGDWLLRYDLATGRTENLGIPIPHQSWVVTEFHEPTRRLYGITIPGKTAQPMKRVFFVYDLDAKKVIFSDGPESKLARAMIFAPDGRAWYDTADGLVMYDPKKNEVVPTDITIPGEGTVRAASRVTKEGISYCITRNGTMFAFDTKDGSIDEMGPAFAFGSLYTAVVALDPTERYLYFVPSAHGRSHLAGTPVIQLDLKTRKRKVIAFLHDVLRRQQQYHVGGSYGIALNDDGSELLINFNGSTLDAKRPDFGLCSVVLIEIPESERPTGD